MRRRLWAAGAVPGGAAADPCLLTVLLAAGAKGPSLNGIQGAQPRVHRGGSRDALDLILLLRQFEIAFAVWRPQHTPLTYTELIVGEKLFAPSAHPLGFGAAVPDSAFVWSCFILLDLAPCSVLGRLSLDPDSLLGPRPPCLPAPGLPRFLAAAPGLHHALLHSVPLAAWLQWQGRRSPRPR